MQRHITADQKNAFVENLIRDVGRPIKVFNSQSSVTIIATDGCFVIDRDETLGDKCNDILGCLSMYISVEQMQFVREMIGTKYVCNVYGKGFHRFASTDFWSINENTERSYITDYETGENFEDPHYGIRDFRAMEDAMPVEEDYVQPIEDYVQPIEDDVLPIGEEAIIRQSMLRLIGMLKENMGDYHERYDIQNNIVTLFFDNASVEVGHVNGAHDACYTVLAMLSNDAVENIDAIHECIGDHYTIRVKMHDGEVRVMNNYMPELTITKNGAFVVHH